MCGLFGHTVFSPEMLGRSRAALHSLQHRGPDDWGEWYDQTAYIGHRRLSILDLSEHGRQPMVSSDGGVVMSANAEIYNFRELKSELSREFEFSSDSDCEVLLHGYRAWGLQSLLSRIEGMFAICIYDRSQGKIYLVRDRVGIKPLYYSFMDGVAVWASELKAIEKFLGADALRVDNTALYDFLTYLYVPAPKTTFERVHKLEAAHYAEIDVATASVETHCYWTLEPLASRVTVADAPEQLRELIGNAVVQQLVSDVAIGFFLSGVMDSSAVVAEVAVASREVRTYSIGFDVGDWDELPYAREVAEYFGTNHMERTLDRDTAVSLFDEMSTWFDEPFADISALPTYLVCALAREQSKVTLTGDGGDEVFGGYLWYATVARKTKRVASLPRFMRRMLRWLPAAFGDGAFKRILNDARAYGFEDGVALYASVRNRPSSEAKARFRRALDIPCDYDDFWSYRRYYREELPLMTRLQYMDFHTYLPDQLLTKVDRASMSVSLEARLPLLDTRVVEFGFGLDEKLRYFNGELKGLLKQAYRGVVPDTVLARKKKGFSVPLHYWRGALLNDRCTRQEALLERWCAARAANAT